MTPYKEQFHEENDLPRVERATKTLVIASTPRSGSHMLGHALRASGAFGFPLKYLQGSVSSEWTRLLGKTTAAETLTEVQCRRTSPNGVFGIKVHHSHLAHIGGFPALQRALPDPYYVLLHRKDALKQAVSWAIASQTGAWISSLKPQATTAAYSYPDIHHRLRRILRETADWRYLLTTHGCRWLELEFSQVAADLPGTILRIAQFAGVEIPPANSPAAQPTRPQANSLNAEWEKRFLADYSGGLLWDESPLAKLKRKIRAKVAAACRGPLGSPTLH